MQNFRYLHKSVTSWLKDRMVFIGGPRQVGKTTFSKYFISKSSCYLNWDNQVDRQLIKKGHFPLDESLLVLDEIHKFSKWRNLLKGIYDKHKDTLTFLVTGSARLDLFRKGGDSLFGRYHYFRMHPFSFEELKAYKLKQPLQNLFNYGGFPEPLFKQNDDFLKIWHRERKARVIQQDLRDLTNLKDYSDLELLADCLPEKVGSLLSLSSIAEDLGKSPHTIANWIEILESVYYCYTILPYGTHRIKATKKARKLYLWDWSEIENEGARFENMVAGHLLKYCHFIEDTKGDRMDLRYVRDNAGKEVDFVILKNKKPLFAIECKLKPSQNSGNLSLLGKKLGIGDLYLVHLGSESYHAGNVQVIPFESFSNKVGLV
jgi:predicted AAA+ superfamily ATPase